MSITRPPALSEEEAQERRSNGARVYQSSQDPRVTWVLMWIAGIVATILGAGILGGFNFLIDMRDDVRDLKNRPAPATASQVQDLQRQIDELRSEVRNGRR